MNVPPRRLPAAWLEPVGLYWVDHIHRGCFQAIENKDGLGTFADFRCRLSISKIAAFGRFPAVLQTICPGCRFYDSIGRLSAYRPSQPPFNNCQDNFLEQSSYLRCQCHQRVR